MIATSYFAPDLELPKLDHNNMAIALILLDHLLGLGHCKIAVLHGPLHTIGRTSARIEALRDKAPPGAISIGPNFSMGLLLQARRIIF